MTVQRDNLPGLGSPSATGGDVASSILGHVPSHSSSNMLPMFVRGHSSSQ